MSPPPRFSQADVLSKGASLTTVVGMYNDKEDRKNGYGKCCWIYGLILGVIVFGMTGLQVTPVDQKPVRVCDLRSDLCGVCPTKSPTAFRRPL